ncbi:nectin-4-like isoform X1 [Astatotilapia calliptera]|uniref:nectin-4-like isoform X1 n=1 Tax=Astatotilapia calliptera TaxID=8154 RepID=UPI000E41AD28|nr:nectin-4-like isoform X1 [Astatotilapia calliptera]
MPFASSPSDYASNLGILLDSSFKFDKQVSAVVKSSFNQLRLISKAKRYIPHNDLEKLIHAFVTYRLDYCNSLYIGLSSSLLVRLQTVQNAAARLLTALQVTGGSVTVEQGGTAILSCYVTGTNDDLTQITWQRKTREKPHNDNFLTILPREGVQFVNGGDDRFKYIGNFNNNNGTLQLSNAALKDEGSYTCIFTLFPSGNQKIEIPLNVLVPPFTSVKDNLPTLGTEEVLFATCTAAGSKPPAEVRWLTGALGDKVRTTANSTQYDNDTTTTVSSLFGVPTREINGHQVQCVISSDSLSKEESLLFTIQVYFSPTEVNIRMISEDSFECVTEAKPNANFIWSRSGQSLLESSVKIDGAKLQLLSLTSDINGLYQCEASNTYGSKRGQLYVHVASGSCSAAWALLGVFICVFFLSIVGAAVWYFYTHEDQRRRFTLFWQRVPTNEPAGNSAAQQEQHQME